jgi:hypothetical protein
MMLSQVRSQEFHFSPVHELSVLQAESRRQGSTNQQQPSRNAQRYGCAPTKFSSSNKTLRHDTRKRTIILLTERFPSARRCPPETYWVRSMDTSHSCITATFRKKRKDWSFGGAWMKQR